MTDNSNNWRGFKGHKWQEEIDVRDFIIQNFTPYEGNDSFLVGPTDRTKKAVSVADVYYAKERENGGVYKIDTQHISSVNDEFDPGYLLDKNEEIIVGLQTDEPLKRAINPFGGLRMAKLHVKRMDTNFQSILKRILNIVLHITMAYLRCILRKCAKHVTWDF